MTALVVALAPVLACPDKAEAHSNCGLGPRWFGTSSGTAIPERGVLYAAGAHAPDVGLGPGVRVRRAWLPRRTYPPPDLGSLLVDDLPPLLGVAVVALHYDATGTDVVETDWGARFAVSKTWTPPQARPRVVSTTRHRRQWTCGFEYTIDLRIDQQVAGFRVRWHDGAAWSEQILPPAAHRQGTVLHLGELACGGLTLPLAALERGVRLDLRAIRFDGSEVAVSGLPWLVRLDDLVMTSDIDSNAVFDHADRPALPAPGGAPAWPRLRIVWVGGVLALLVAGAIVARRRRRPHVAVVAP
jgi:hypothetical protein